MGRGQQQQQQPRTRQDRGRTRSNSVNDDHQRSYQLHPCLRNRISLAAGHVRHHERQSGTTAAEDQQCHAISPFSLPPPPSYGV